MNIIKIISNLFPFFKSALGPQNSFATSARTARKLHIFDEDDFQRAWEKVNGKDSSHCRLSRLPDVMQALFRGPVPPNDLYYIAKAFEDTSSFETPETISFISYARIMITLRDEASRSEREFDGKLKPTCEFNSSREFKDSMTRHHRMERDVQQKQIAPLTSTQEYGWDEQELQPPVAGRNGSEITKYAAELVKNGIYY